MPTGKEFTDKQQMFVDAHQGDIKATAKKIGISYEYARKLATRKPIVDAIRNRITKGSSKRGRIIASREERQAFWTRVLYGDESQPETTGYDENGNAVVIDIPPKMTDRLKASELLGRSEADFTDKHLHDLGKETAKHVYGHLDKKGK